MKSSEKRMTLEETLREVMQHAVSGRCGKNSSVGYFGRHCGDPLHALHIFAKNGYIITGHWEDYQVKREDFFEDADEFFDMLDEDSKITFGSVQTEELSGNRFDPPAKSPSHSLVSRAATSEERIVAQPYGSEE